MTDTCVDLSNLRELTDGDKELEEELFQEFITGADEIIESLSTTNDNEEWRQAAHALKGISLNLGAARLSELSSSAQGNFEQGRDEKNIIIENIKAEYAKVVDCLKAEHP